MLMLKARLDWLWLNKLLEYQQITDFSTESSQSPALCQSTKFALITAGFCHCLHVGSPVCLFVCFIMSGRHICWHISIWAVSPFRLANRLTGRCGHTGRPSYSRLRASATFSAALFSACSSCWMPCDWLAILEQKSCGQRRRNGEKSGGKKQNEGRRNGGFAFFLEQLASADSASRCRPLTWPRDHENDRSQNFPSLYSKSTNAKWHFQHRTFHRLSKQHICMILKKKKIKKWYF